MKIPNPCCVGLASIVIAGTVTTARAEPAAPAGGGDVVAFCKAHPSLDFPDRLYFGPGYTPGETPKQLSKLDGPLQWRCRDARVWVCLDSADGDWCGKKDASRRPSAILREACHDDPESTSLTFADEHYSAYDWRCKAGIPVIIKSYPLDRQGLFKASWRPLIVRHGVVVGPTDFPEGPR